METCLIILDATWGFFIWVAALVAIAWFMYWVLGDDHRKES